MAKQGFKGQWVEIAKVGKFFDDTNAERDLSADFFNQVVANYSASEYEAPAVIGHPMEDNPAFGWVSEVRLNGDTLEAKFAETDDTFEQLVEEGRFKKRSTAFYLKPPKGSSRVAAPTIKHVGFLGAVPPAVKGLRNIQFAEGDSFTLESSFNLQEKNMGLEDTDVEKVTTGVFEKLKGFFSATGGTKEPDANSAQFSEAKVTEIVTAAIETARTEIAANFQEKLDAKDTKITELETRINTGVATGVKAEIAQFMDSLPAANGKHWLKNIGTANFLESLADADAKDETKAISFSEGEGDAKVTHEFSRLEFAKNLLNALPPMIQFGEKFGNIVATKEADAMIDLDRVERMKKAAAVETKSGGEK